jgi:hypothetical protein
LSKALLVSVFAALPLAIIDYALATYLHLTPLIRLPVLVIVFAFSFLVVCRQLFVFTENDFELVENAVPQVLVRYLDALERFLVSRHTA